MDHWFAPLLWIFLALIIVPIAVYLSVKLGRKAYLKAGQQFEQEQDQQSHLRNGRPKPQKELRHGQMDES
jgi:hypothetical protein